MNRVDATATPVFGGIEGGGTKFNCAIGPSPGEIWARTSFATTTPQETLGRVIEFFAQSAAKYGPLRALGLASFGPVDLCRQSKYYGYITTTPKQGWAYTDMAGTFSRALKVPLAFDTDVNAAAIGEGQLGAARGLQNFVYVTIGTGIGAGVVMDGRLANGAMHPEIGHMLLPRDAADGDFPGVCPFHGDCLEGLAAGPAIAARWGRKGQDLPADHTAWQLQARYLAAMCVNLSLCYAPQRIILGGGVMSQAQLFAGVRSEFARLLKGYAGLPAATSQDDYIVPAALNGCAGEVGALVAAERLIEQSDDSLTEVYRV